MEPEIIGGSLFILFLLIFGIVKVVQWMRKPKESFAEHISLPTTKLKQLGLRYDRTGKILIDKMGRIYDSTGKLTGKILRQ